MAIGQNFYGDGDEINNLFRSQANQSINAGYNAADLADPFRNERKGYQNSLRSLMANPGEFSSSPVYKFAYDQGLNALQRKGSIRSGNKLAELMKYGQGMASQMYFPQANLLSTLSGATTGSPAAAGLAVSGAFNRSQDQRQAGKAAEMYRQPQAPQFTSAGTGLPSGGGGGGGGGRGGFSGYSSMYPDYDYGAIDTPGVAGWINTANGPMPYQPSSMAGTGYMSSDYGTYDFGTVARGDSSYTPTYYTPSYTDYGLPGYTDYGDWGGGYDSGGSDFGWDE